MVSATLATRRGERGGFSLWELVVVVAVIGVLFTFLAPMAAKLSEHERQARCAQNLLSIARAASQYATNCGFYPHLGKPPVLDGTYWTDTSTRCLRALVWSGELDDPSVFVCPSSFDASFATAERGKSWLWHDSMAGPRTTASPIVASSGDPPLSASTELSYGWTMIQYTTNGGNGLIAADKAKRQINWDYCSTSVSPHMGNMIGNHKECMLAVSQGGSIYRATPRTPGINTSNVGSAPGPGVDGGNLGVLNDETPDG